MQAELEIKSELSCDICPYSFESIINYNTILFLYTQI